MFRWEVSEWSRCRAECNGLKTRNVECVSDEAGAKLLVTATSHYLQIIRKLKRVFFMINDPQNHFESIDITIRNILSHHPYETYLSEMYSYLTLLTQVDESLCLGSRPESELPCTNTNCPEWYAGAWSGVSHFSHNNESHFPLQG